MPIYEYKCEDCGKKLEVIERFSDNKVKKCDKCGGDASRVISASAFHLKGGGWYSEGYSKPKSVSCEGQNPECSSCPNAPIAGA